GFAKWTPVGMQVTELDRRVRAEGEDEMRPTRSLLLGVSVGLFGVLVVLVVKYVAVVLTG
ncbi:MAG TPA: hypothetical protein VHM22_02290, partial [Bradyrhizobium sp.]|nr:hypothetical protein [Bradyrhizobium sp.]